MMRNRTLLRVTILALLFFFLAVSGGLVFWFRGGLQAPQAKGPAGAAEIKELVERYKSAHRDKDVEAMRAIYLPAPNPVPALWRGRMIGQAERDMPRLFGFDLADVEVIEVAPLQGAFQFDYMVERAPSRANGFSPIRIDSVMSPLPYKLLLIGRRAADPKGPLMELDCALGVRQIGDRFYLYASDTILEAVADWVQTGTLPGVHRPPEHHFLPDPDNWPKRVPDDWIRVVRPRP